MNKSFIEKKELTFTDIAYENFQEMADFAEGWELRCNYQLSSSAINGHYKILKLPTMQLAFSNNLSGLMYNFDAPKNHICISVMKHIEGKACLDNIKLQNGDIVFFDDSKRYNFMASSKTELLDISIKKSTNSILYHRVMQAYKSTIVDTNQTLQTLLLNIINKYGNTEDLNIETAIEIERKISSTLLKILKIHKPKQKILTKGEQVVATIRDEIIYHMDAAIDIHYLANKYQVSERTLQNSFQSLFGFTPTNFLRLLKLNLVRNELIEGTPQTHTVLRIAQKWGFMHMGRFSTYYKKLFLETPSSTLKTIFIPEGISEDCVERQSEIN